MVKQLRPDATTFSGNRYILRRPELAAQLGAIAAEWSLLEENLIMFYGFLMGLELPRKHRRESYPIHPVALQVFTTIETLELRLRLLTRLAKWRIDDAKLLSGLDKLAAFIRAAGKQRNKLLHAHWGLADEHPDALIMIPVFGPRLIYAASDFNETLEKIEAARKMIAEIEMDVREHTLKK